MRSSRVETVPSPGFFSLRFFSFCNCKETKKSCSKKRFLERERGERGEREQCGFWGGGDTGENFGKRTVGYL